MKNIPSTAGSSKQEVSGQIGTGLSPEQLPVLTLERLDNLNKRLSCLEDSFNERHNSLNERLSSVEDHCKDLRREWVEIDKKRELIQEQVVDINDKLEVIQAGVTKAMLWSQLFYQIQPASTTNSTVSQDVWAWISPECLHFLEEPRSVPP